MANPRQRRKARSGTHKAVSHSRRAQQNLKKMPTVRGPKVLQDSWDKHKTVRQNYAALGLVHDLNPSASGGVERIEDSNIQNATEDQVQLTDAIPSSLNPDESPSATIPKGYGKIVRDEAGNIVRVELGGETDDSEAPPALDEPVVPPAVMSKWVADLGGGQHPNSQINVVRELERISTPGNTNPNGTTLSAPLSGVGARHASRGEKQYLQQLVDKFGTNVGAMTRDRKLNVHQRTEGELRRALKRAGLMSV